MLNVEKEIGSKKGQTLRKVLLAEDCKDTQFLLSIILSKAGFEVVCVENGEECLKVAFEDILSFDLILLDVNMPILGGRETAKILRRAKFKKPIIALSALGEEDDYKKSIDAGCDDHFYKLAGEKALNKTIERHLSKKETKIIEVPLLKIVPVSLKDSPYLANLALHYLAKLETYIEDLAKALDAKDTKGINRALGLLAGAQTFDYRALHHSINEFKFHLKMESKIGAQRVFRQIVNLSKRMIAAREDIARYAGKDLAISSTSFSNEFEGK